MNTTLTTAVFAAGIILGTAGGYGLARADATARLLDAFARMLGGSWYSPARTCPGCGKRKHVMRYVRHVGHRCVTCAGGAR